ncbi:MAG: HD domain-containing protein, partial [Candidatus Gastranaerophilales bacterium]|nr:HD domain-containing protein [Candidatus Gastranaerophilales bacterium]
MSKIIENQFHDFAMTKDNLRYKQAISRVDEIYKKQDDIRSPFERDYHRILYSNAYRRLKHKTQVFFATNNDHICTRIEHVNHVSSAAECIARCMGLNVELSRAIATGHDLGHPPFGHTGESILKETVINLGLGNNFWHEKNSLRFIDYIETLPDYEGFERNLNLSYAVRDGIICHCGEVVENGLLPREDFINLETIESANQYQSYTWEGLVVKVADKIAYLGRDIEDALSKKILTEEQKSEFEVIIKDLFGSKKLTDINTSSLVHLFTIDLCKNSNPDMGLCFSKEYYKIMCMIKDFNYKHIYK